MKKGSLLNFAFVLFGKLVVAGILSLILNFTLLAAYESQVLNVLVLILGFVLQSVLVYTSAWQYGYSDVNRNKYVNKKADLTKGLKAGAIAVIPVLAVFGVLLFVKFGFINEAFVSFYALLNPSYLPFILSYLPRTLTSAEIPLINFVISVLPCMVIPAITAWAAYYLGFNDYSISGNILYSNKK